MASAIRTASAQSCAKLALTVFKIRKGHPLIFLLWITVITASAQTQALMPDRYLSSPSAAELGRYGEVSLGLFTGTAEVNIPIYELKTRNLILPISLNYRSNGLQVNKVSSNVGFDWSLFAGGVITRIVKGHPDEHQKFHWATYPVDPQKPTSELTEEEKSSIANFLFLNWDDEADTEPDLYAYNFAGTSGQFYIRDNGEIITVPYQKLKIVGPNPFFTITTPDGIVYEFKASEIVGGFTTMSYHLSKITDPEGDVINFYYKASGSYWYKTGITDNIYDFEWQSSMETMCSSNVVQGYPYAKAHRTHVVSTIVLDSIVAVGYGKIVFNTDDNRLDVPELRISGLDVYNPMGEKIRSVEFFHQFPYTTNYSNTPALEENGEYNGDNVNYRMFLDAVVIRDGQNRDVLRYGFEYNDLNALPIRLSYSQDHWGYFNGAQNNSLLPDQIPEPIKSTRFAGVLANASRNPNEEFAEKGMLRRISYPTGGYTLFVYETNKDYGGNKQGGVRLQQQINYNLNGHQTGLKRYSYSNATGYDNFLQYFRSYSFETYCWEYHPDGLPDGPFSHLYTVYWLSSSPLRSPSQPAYGKVIIYYAEGTEFGREEHEFDNTRDQADVQLYGQFSQHPIELTNYSWKSGRKTAERYYSNNHLVKSIEYHYVDDSRIDLTKSYVTIQQSLPGASGYNDYNHIGNYFNVSRYSIISKWSYLQSKIISVYDLAGTNPVTTTFSYHYDNEVHAQLTREVQTLSTGELRTKQIFYPQDYSPIGSFSTLTSKFILSKVVDERVYNDNRLISGSQIRYNGYGQPVDTYEAEPSAALQDIVFNPNDPYTFVHKNEYLYNEKGLLRSNHVDNNISTSYLWSYNSTLPVAKIENADEDDILLATSDLGEYFVSTLENARDQTEIENKLIALRAEIESELPMARLTTFTHYPLVGLKSSADPNGRSTHYEYDDFGRLSKVKDHNLNVLKALSYQYVPLSALPKLDISRVSMPFNEISSSQTFQVLSHGEWNLSDDRDWIHVSNASGNGYGIITVTVDENPNFAERSGTITIQDASGHQLTDRKVRVYQEAHPNYVGISLSSLSYGYASQSQSFLISSATSWDIATDALWVGISQTSGTGNGTISVTVSENASFSTRTATLTIRDLSGNGSPNQVVSIEQVGSPSHLTANSAGLHFETAGGSMAIQLDANVSWTASDDQSWLTVTPSNGIGDGTISIAATQNTEDFPRTGFVQITDQSGGNNMATVSVTQAGTSNYISLSASSLYFDSGTQDAEFDIFSNLNSWSTRINYINGYGWLDEIYPFNGFLSRGDVEVHVNQLPPAGHTWQAQIEVFNNTLEISSKISVYVTN